MHSRRRNKQILADGGFDGDPALDFDQTLRSHVDSARGDTAGFGEIARHFRPGRRQRHIDGRDRRFVVDPHTIALLGNRRAHHR